MLFLIGLTPDLESITVPDWVKQILLWQANRNTQILLWQANRNTQILLWQANRKKHEWFLFIFFIGVILKTTFCLCHILQLCLHLGPYSPTILKNILCLILQIFLVLEAFECNTTSDWLNHTV